MACFGDSFTFGDEVQDEFTYPAFLERLEPGIEALGGVQHIAISVPQDRWDELRATLDAAGVPYDGPQRGIPESMYLRDPDGNKLCALHRPPR